VTTRAPVRVGLVGYGTSGSIFHAPFIAAAERLQLSAVMTSRREKASHDLPGVRIVSSPEELWNDRTLDLIVVASPTATHYEIARGALLAGKHVVIDKPMTTTAAEADELIAMAAERGRLLTVYQNRRWDGDYLTVKNVVGSGRLGKVFQYEAHYDRFRPWMKGGWREQELPGSGILYDLGAHLVDQALQLFGTPDSMMADVFRQRDGANADDYFHLLLRYGRLRVILHASMFVLEPGPHYAVYGDRGSFVKYGMDPQEDQLRAGLHPGDANWGVDANERAGVLALADGSREEIVTERGAWESFYQGVTAALLDGAPAPVNAKDSRNVVALIESAALTK
jgi:scyllo-inositol 2-dehydrogenase (NADP+)